jgi:hypothetical protein
MTTRNFMIAAAVVAALALAFYLGQGWPLKALMWAEHIVEHGIGAKILAKTAMLLGAASGMLWAGFAARRK